MPFNVTSRSLVTVTRLLPLLVPAANLLPEAVDGLLLDAKLRESTGRSYIPRGTLSPWSHWDTPCLTKVERGCWIGLVVRIGSLDVEQR